MNKIWKLVLQPLLLRAGTAIATWLVASGVAQSQAEQIVTGLMALALVLADLVADKSANKSEQR